MSVTTDKKFSSSAFDLILKPLCLCHSTNHNSSSQNFTNNNAPFYLERIIFLAVIISALHSLLILFILIVFNPVWLGPEKKKKAPLVVSQ
jgi:hypothetical protein